MKRLASIYLPLTLWVLTMISLPILGWILGEDWLIRGMNAGVLMQAAATLAILSAAWGWLPTLKTFALIAVLSYLAELLGSQTGFPFGKYHYTNLLQPQLIGVPIIIPLAWLMMLPSAWAVSKIILTRASPRLPILQTPAAHAIFSGLVFTAWDLFLDPQMVGWGFWVWEIPGGYFGIPFSNYLGWLVISTLITLIVNPRALPLFPLALMYGLTWALQTIGQGFFWSQPGPALAGFLGSGLFVILAWRNFSGFKLESSANG